MGSFFKIISVTSCAFLLCLGLSFAMLIGNAVSGTERMKAGPPGERIGGQGGRDYDQAKREHVVAQAGQKSDQKKDGFPEGIKTIKGDVVRAKDDSVVIMTQDGTELLLHIDNTTEKPRNIRQGEGIEAKVNDQNHVVAILSESAVHDRRNAK